jgi:hypothetical protein
MLAPTTDTPLCPRLSAAQIAALLATDTVNLRWCGLPLAIRCSLPQIELETAPRH